MGRAEAIGPPHYPWLVAVDPRGALLIAGMGEHGITRVRGRRSSDRSPDELYPRYYEGQIQWRLGSPTGDTPSFSFKFGWDGHNYLGFPDAWGLTGAETDQQLFDLFGAPASLRQNAARPTSGSTRCGRAAARRRRRPRLVRHRPGTTSRRCFAEGSTGTFFDTRLALVNPDAQSTDAVLRFQRDDGTVVTETLTVPGRTRRTLLPRTIAGLDRATFSTVIESSLPLVIDRTMTWPDDGYGSHAETSLPGPSTTVVSGRRRDVRSVRPVLSAAEPERRRRVTVAVTYLRSAPLAPLEKTTPSARTAG